MSCVMVGLVFGIACVCGMVCVWCGVCKYSVHVSCVMVGLVLDILELLETCLE